MDELLAGAGRFAWCQCWQVTLLIAAVWLVLRMVGRNRPHLACTLWLVVLLKCVTPPLVSSPSGIFCWLQREELKQAADGQSILAIAADVPTAAPDGDAIVVRAAPVIQAIPRLQMPIPPDLSSYRANALPLETGRSWSSLLLAVALAWLAGTVVCGAVAVVRWRVCWRRICRSRQIENPELTAVVDALCRRLKLRGPVRLLVTESSLGPAVIGLWRPSIILPAAIVGEKSPAEVAPLLAHELIHIRRGDLWIGMLQTLAVAAWWFHPLVRLASRLVTREAERCCDEETIALLGCRPADYARSLLDVLALKQQLTPIPAFPGVRPVDVTSQRLERIMQLGQGCHRRTPWWCWLVMLAVAAAVLPGATLVVGAKEKPKAPTPAATQYVRPDSPRAVAAAEVNEAELETRIYDVEDLHAALGKEPCQSEDEAKQLLINLVVSAGPGPQGGAGDSPNRWLTWDNHKLLVRHTAAVHQRIADQLNVFRLHGYAEMAVEVRIVSGPKAMLNAAGIDWQMLAASGTDEESRQRDPSGKLVGRAESVVERQLPAMVALVNEEQAKALLETAQADRRSNVLQAPKVTLFNGQSARVMDVVQRPFVVGVTPAKDGNPSAMKPQVKLVSEGMTIRLRPVAQKDGPCRLEFGLTLSQIRDVDTAEFPIGPGQEPISVQIPEVVSTRLNTTVDLNAEQTLVLSVPKTGKGKKEQQPLSVLVKVRKIESPREAAVPSPRKTVSDEPKQILAAAHAAEPLAFESSGWRLRFAPQEGSRLEVEQADARKPLARLSIRGGVLLEAAAEREGKEKPDRFQAQADVVQVMTHPATADAPRRLQITLDGNVRLMHNGSRMEARKILLSIDDPFAAKSAEARKPAKILVQLQDAKTVEVPGRSYVWEDVFLLGSLKADPVLIDKVYPVADLVIPVPSGPIKISPSGSQAKRESQQAINPDFASLIDLITTTIRPDSWDRVGGHGEVSVATNSLSLVIRQEDHVHQMISDLLTQLRRLQDIQVVLKLERLEVSAAELASAAGNAADSPLAAVVDNPKSRAWCLKPDVANTLKRLPTAKVQPGPKITAFNGQTVGLPRIDGKMEAELMPGLLVQPIVTADFRSLRMQIFGDVVPDSSQGSDDTPPSPNWRAGIKAPPKIELPKEHRELVLGHVLVVDESQFAWQENDRGVPVAEKVPGAARLFRNVAVPKPDNRHFYLITPQVLVTSEEEEVLAPRHTKAN